MSVSKKSVGLLLGLIISFFSQFVFALQERHLIIIQHGEGEDEIAAKYNTNPKHANYKPAPLTDKGRQQIKQTAEILLTYGFDNRNISAVFVSPLLRTLETAEIMADIGVFTKDKIHIEQSLIEMQAGEREGLSKTQHTKDSWFVGLQEAKFCQGESNEQVRKRMLAFYEQTQNKYPEGHILFITHGVPAMELIDSVTKQRVKLQSAQAYMMPLNNQTMLS